MKSFDSRTYSINDFVEWDKNGQLELNPSFQRRPVWSDTAKSYLMDTIIRGKPMPKVFIRQKINVAQKSSIRDVVDGQQRIRTILSYVKDGFVISKRHNREFGGLKFSELDTEIQSNILTYEVGVDLLINLPDSDILDIFGRLNSYAITLNDQEKINASHFSEFKILADSIGRKYYDYWTGQKLLSSQQVLRMQEVNLVADLLIAMIEGVKSKKQIGKFYNDYESSFSADPLVLDRQFDETISTISKIFPGGLKSTEFTRIHLFYSLFTTVFHCLFGLPNLTAVAPDLRAQGAADTARHKLDRVRELFGAAGQSVLSADERQFIEDSRRATTDEAVRLRRIRFLLKLMA